MMIVRLAPEASATEAAATATEAAALHRAELALLLHAAEPRFPVAIELLESLG